MKLMRYERPELSAPLSRLDSWTRDPFMGLHWPRFFDRNWSADWDALTPAHRHGADLFEDDEAYHLRLELPGVKKKNLDIELDNAVVTVSCERRSKSNDSGESSERFSRSISVPDGILADRVHAKLEDGVLTVTLPKAESSKPRAIKVS